MEVILRWIDGVLDYWIGEFSINPSLQYSSSVRMAIVQHPDPVKN